MEAMEALSLLAAFAVLHIIFIQIGRIRPPSSAQSRNFLHMKELSASFVFTFLVGALWAHNTAVCADQEERVRLLNYLHSAKLAFSPREIALLAGTREDMNRLSYRDIKLRLQELVSVLPKTRFTYLMGQRENNVIFLADSAPDDSEDASLPGQIYAEASDTLRSVLSSGQDATEGPLPDQYGSGFRPLSLFGTKTGGGFAILAWTSMPATGSACCFAHVFPRARDVAGFFTFARCFFCTYAKSPKTERLAQSEQNTASCSRNPGCLLLLQDTFIDCNAAAERLFACSRAEILGHYPWVFSPRAPAGCRFSQKRPSNTFPSNERRCPTLSLDSQSCEGKTLHTEVCLHLLPMELPRCRL